MDESISGFHFSCYFPHTYHFSYSFHCRFHFSLYFHWGFHLISHFHVHHRLHFRSYFNFPNTPISKGIKFISLFLPFSLSPPLLSLSLSLFFLALGFFGFASTSFCGLASTGFSSGLASTGFFGFVLSGVLQNSFASY